MKCDSSGCSIMRGMNARMVFTGPIVLVCHSQSQSAFGVPHTEPMEITPALAKQ